MQIFLQPIYDKLAKYILQQDEGFRNYILSTLSGVKITTSRTLDTHLEPLDEKESLRRILNTERIDKSFDELYDAIDRHPEMPGFEFAKKIYPYWDQIKAGSRLPKHNSQVDFLCETAYGDLTIEFQLSKKQYWDDRALAYIASIYSNQLERGATWEKAPLNQVVGINLLGRGDVSYWSDNEYKRHYMFQNQLTTHRLDRLQLIQYSLGDVNFDHEDFKKNKNLKDVLEFFKEAHHKNKTPENIRPPA